jgi:microcystin-dependent protein
MRNYSSTATEKTLAGNVLITDTQITLSDSTGLPSVPFTLVLNPDTNIEEIVTVNTDQSGVTAPTYKVTRAQDGTSASAHTSANIVRHMITARDLQEPQNHIAATTSVHGITDTSLLVTTTGTETLTNKRLNSPKFNENVAMTATSTELNVLDGITASTTELNYVDGVTSNIQTQFNNLVTVPTGTVSMFAGSSAPTGWLLCDGSSFDSGTYSALASLLGDTYGTHSSTTYYLPNLKGKVAVGRDSSQSEFDTLGETGGAKTVTLNEAQMPAHTHTLTPGQVVGGGSGGTNNYAPTGNNPTANTSITSTGGGEAHPNLQPYIVLNYIIKH